MKRAPAPAHWRMLTRQGCHLCDQMAAVLDRGLGPRGTAWIEVDVDGDPELRERFGETVPVLLRDGHPVAKVRIDEATLRRLVERR
jgi:glutaredoxin